MLDTFCGLDDVVIDELHITLRCSDWLLEYIFGYCEQFGTERSVASGFAVSLCLKVHFLSQLT